MEASEMYARTIENLRRSIEQHRTPDGRSSVKAFAEVYGFSRQNLVEVLGQKQELSIDLFLRLEAALHKKPAPATVPGVERWSLRTWLAAQELPVHNAMYSINFGG